ncbi:MAG: hypothetical protein GY851_32160, partial [bacterium]|nr:hypothetical protein [bacterium]
MQPLILTLPRQQIRGAKDMDWSDLEMGYTTTLAKAVSHQFRCDGHAVGYHVQNGEPLKSSPRINKPSLTALAEAGHSVVHSVLFVDVDNPDHAAWDSKDQASEVVHNVVEGLSPGNPIAYTSKHGYRLVWPLSEPWVLTTDNAKELEARIAGFLLALTDQGVDVDMACRDWTRLFRLPHVVRDGETQDPVVVVPDEIGTVNLENYPRMYRRGGDWETHEDREARRAEDQKVADDEDGRPDWDTIDMVEYFRRLGRYRRELEDGKHSVECPWAHNHSNTTGEDGTDAVVWSKPPDGDR